jgi:hypothetical protein
MAQGIGQVRFMRLRTRVRWVTYASHGTVVTLLFNLASPIHDWYDAFSIPAAEAASEAFLKGLGGLPYYRPAAFLAVRDLFSSA